MEEIQEGSVIVEDIKRFAHVFNTVFSSSPENLALLAKHCTVETLRNFRLVSRQFHSASLDAWRNKATLRIDARVGLGMKPVPRSKGQERLFHELGIIVGCRDGPQILVEELARLVRNPRGRGKHHGTGLVGRSKAQYHGMSLGRRDGGHLHQRLFEKLGHLVRSPGAQHRLVEQLARLVGRPKGQHHVVGLVPEDHQRLFEELGHLVRSPWAQQRLVEVLLFLVPFTKCNEHGLDIREFYEMINNPEKDIFNLIDHPFRSYKLKLQKDEIRPRQNLKVSPSPTPTIQQYFTDFVRRIHFFGGSLYGSYFTCLSERFRNVEEIVFEDFNFEPGLDLMAVNRNMSLDNVKVIKIVNPNVRSVVINDNQARRFRSLFPNLKILTVTFNPEDKNGFYRLRSLTAFRGWRDTPGLHHEHIISYREIEDLLMVQTSPIEQLQIDLAPKYYNGNIFIATRLNVKSLILRHPRDLQPINAFRFNIDLPTLEELELKDGMFTNLKLENSPSLDNVTVVKIVNPREGIVVLSEDKIRMFQKTFPNLKMLTVIFKPNHETGLFRLGSLNEFYGWRDALGQHPEHLLPYREIEDLLRVRTSPIEQLQIDLAPKCKNYSGNIFIPHRLSVKNLILHHPQDFQPIYAFRFNIDLPTLEELELKDGDFTNLKLENSPSLDNVTVVKIVNPKKGSVQLTADEIRRFQISFPNLKILTLTFKAEHKNGFCWLGSLKDFRGWRNVRGQTPENMIYYREIKDFLTYQKSPVEKLRIHVATQYENYVDVLVANSSSLKNLTLYRPRDLVPINGFPFHIELPSLEELELWGGVTTNLKFFKLMPRLQKVVFDLDLILKKRSLVPALEEGEMAPYRSSTDFDENTDFLDLSVTMEHLVHLEIDDRIGKESWEKLAECHVLPNLQVLKTILGRKSFAVICENWRKLKKLSLMFGSDVNDKALTGIGKAFKLEGVHLELELERAPNLIDLKELTDFELLTYCGRSKITDKSVIHGFLKMPLLEKLTVCVSSQMTSEAEKLLKKKIDCVNVYRNYKSHRQVNAEIHCCDKTAIVFGI